MKFRTNIKRTCAFVLFIVLLVLALYCGIQMAFQAPREFLTFVLMFIGVAWFAHTVASAALESESNNGDEHE